jgi:hypothetical protein
MCRQPFFQKPHESLQLLEVDMTESSNNPWTPILTVCETSVHVDIRMLGIDMVISSDFARHSKRSLRSLAEIENVGSSSEQ